MYSGRGLGNVIDTGGIDSPALTEISNQISNNQLYADFIGGSMLPTPTDTVQGDLNSLTSQLTAGITSAGTTSVVLLIGGAIALALLLGGRN